MTKLQMLQKLQGDLGNTKTKSLQCRKWVFTLNNYEEDDYKFLCDKLSTARKFVYQAEAGESGTKHIQGYVLWKNQKRFSTMQKLIPKAHLEKAKGSDQQNFQYCTKKEGRILPPKFKGFPKEISTIQNFKPWQKDVLDFIKTKPDNRTINWFWDTSGNTGKTSLAKYICVNFNCLYLTGRASDCKFAIKQHFENDECNKDDLIIIFDFARYVESYVSYQILEEVKNGIFFSGKYEGGMCIFNSPHVIVFANFEPDTEKLSADRWKIKKLD